MYSTVGSTNFGILIRVGPDMDFRPDTGYPAGYPVFPIGFLIFFPHACTTHCTIHYSAYSSGVQRGRDPSQQHLHGYLQVKQRQHLLPTSAIRYNSI